MQICSKTWHCAAPRSQQRSELCVSFCCSVPPCDQPMPSTSRLHYDPLCVYFESLEGTCYALTPMLLSFANSDVCHECGWCTSQAACQPGCCSLVSRVSAVLADASVRSSSDISCRVTSVCVASGLSCTLAISCSRSQAATRFASPSQLLSDKMTLADATCNGTHIEGHAGENVQFLSRAHPDMRKSRLTTLGSNEHTSSSTKMAMHFGWHMACKYCAKLTDPQSLAPLRLCKCAAGRMLARKTTSLAVN